MIQRIQSIYLLVAAGLIVAFLAFGGVWRELAAFVFPWAWGIVLAVGGLTALASLVAIFLYKDRPRQRQAAIAAQWLVLLLLLVLVGLSLAANVDDAIRVGTAPYLTALLPLAAYLCLRFARRGIEKDIALVKSMDRLR